MPWLPFYADATDFQLLHDWLNDSSELAFIIPDGQKRWRAVNSIPVLEGPRICLWHIQSGALPLLYPPPSREIKPIDDPWKGWEEIRQRDNPSTPYFGPGHPGIIWLNHRTEMKQDPNGIGLSSFEWIGNHYRLIGSAAKPDTEFLWKSLRRWVQKHAKRIPRSGPVDGQHPEIYAFPSALAAIESGVQRDANP